MASQDSLIKSGISATIAAGIAGAMMKVTYDRLNGKKKCSRKERKDENDLDAIFLGGGSDKKECKASQYDNESCAIVIPVITFAGATAVVFFGLNMITNFALTNSLNTKQRWARTIASTALAAALIFGLGFSRVQKKAEWAVAMTIVAGAVVFAFEETIATVVA